MTSAVSDGVVSGLVATAMDARVVVISDLVESGVVVSETIV